MYYYNISHSFIWCAPDNFHGFRREEKKKCEASFYFPGDRGSDLLSLAGPRKNPLTLLT